MHCWHRILPESNVLCWSFASVQRSLLVIEIFCYCYLTITPLTNNAYKNKIWYLLQQFLGLNIQNYSDSLGFDIFIAQCLVMYFFTRHSARVMHGRHWPTVSPVKLLF